MDDYENNFFILKGSAGTGKTTVISHLLNEERFKHLKIAFTATTNKAPISSKNLVDEGVRLHMTQLVKDMELNCS